MENKEAKDTFKVLIADGVSLNRSVLRSVLGGTYRTETASCAQEVLSAVHERGPYGVIFVSQNLEDNGFFRVLKALHEEKIHEKSPLIMIAENPDDEILTFAYDYGCVDFITKPFIPVAVKQKTEYAVECIRNRNVKNYDTVAPVLNRTSFLSEIKDKTGFVVSVNVKNFSRINLRYGFETGDSLLVYLSDLLSSSFAMCPLGRFDSDHFYILTDEGDAAEKIRDVSQKLRQRYSGVNVKLQAGIKQRDDIGIKPEADCDKAFFACKSIDDNYNIDCQKYGDMKNGGDVLDSFILDNFDTALNYGYIKLAFQPIIRAVSNNLCSQETFARWTDPNLGSIRPVSFVPVLEKYGLSHRLDLYVIESICRDYIPLMEKENKLIPTSINLSSVDFENCEMVREINRILEKYGIDPHLINFEVSCQKYMKNAEKILKDLERLKSFGHTIVLDNFGRGTVYTNDILEYGDIIDMVKVDMKYLKRLKDTDKSLLAHTIDILKRSGYQITAQGVETRKQCNFLMEIGCDRFQGNLFGKPGKMDDYLPSSKIENAEDTALNDYYNAIGKINLLSFNPMEELQNTSFFEDSIALAMVELTENHFHFISATDSFRDSFKVLGLKSLKDLESEINDSNNGYYNAFIRMAGVCSQSHKTERLDLNNNGISVSFMTRLVSKYKYASAFIVCMFGVSRVNSTGASHTAIDPSSLYENLSVSHALFEVIPDNSNRIAKDIVFRHANRRYIENSGVTSGQLLGSSFYKIFPEEKNDWKRMCYGAAFECEEFKGIYYFKKIDSWAYYIITPSEYPCCCSLIIYDVGQDLKKTVAERNSDVIEKIILKCSRLMNNITDYHKTMEDLLSVLGKAVDAERTYIFENHGKYLENTFEWCASGVESQMDNLKQVPSSYLTDSHVAPGDRGSILIDDIEVLKNSGSEGYDILKKQGIKSVFMIPLVEKEKVIGWLGADNFKAENKNGMKGILEAASGFITSSMYTERLIEEMKSMGQKDQLTGLLNRSAMNEFTSSLEKSHEKLGIIFADINGLKACNDEYGHAAGDLLIQNAAELLKTIFDSRYIFRVGGDEFMVIIPSISRDFFDKKVAMLREAVGEMHDLSLAVGAEWTEDSAEHEVISNIADDRMYRDKDEWYRTHGKSRRED